MRPPDASALARSSLPLCDRDDADEVRDSEEKVESESEEDTLPGDARELLPEDGLLPLLLSEDAGSGEPGSGLTADGELLDDDPAPLLVFEVDVLPRALPLPLPVPLVPLVAEALALVVPEVVPEDDEEDDPEPLPLALLLALTEEEFTLRT